MSAARPWVLYLSPEQANLGGSYLTPADPLLDALRDVANVVHVLVPMGRYGKIRSVVAERAGGLTQLSSPEGQARSSGRQILYKISNLANRFDSVSLPKMLKGVVPRPNLIFVNDVSVSLTGMDKVDIEKAFWVNDPHISVDRYFDIHHISQYDIVFVAQKDYVETFKSRGCKNVHWLPLACNPRYFVGSRSDEYNIGFVGKVYAGHPRETVLKMLQADFTGVHIGTERLYDLGLVYRSSKIVVNRSLNSELNLRTFEAMAAGSMLITDRIGNGLLDIFEEGVHLACYDCIDELREKVKFFLEHNDERLRIASTGRDEVLRNHTAAARARLALELALHR